MMQRKNRKNSHMNGTISAHSPEMAAINRVLDKLDNIDGKIEQMKIDNKRQAITSGSIAGGISGAIVSLSFYFMKMGG